MNLSFDYITTIIIDNLMYVSSTMQKMSKITDVLALFRGKSTLSESTRRSLSPEEVRRPDEQNHSFKNADNDLKHKYIDQDGNSDDKSEHNAPAESQERGCEGLTSCLTGNTVHRGNIEDMVADAPDTHTNKTSCNTEKDIQTTINTVDDVNGVEALDSERLFPEKVTQQLSPPSAKPARRMSRKELRNQLQKKALAISQEYRDKFMTDTEGEYKTTPHIEKENNNRQPIDNASCGKADDLDDINEVATPQLSHSMKSRGAALLLAAHSCSEKKRSKMSDKGSGNLGDCLQQIETDNIHIKIPELKDDNECEAEFLPAQEKDGGIPSSNTEENCENNMLISEKISEREENCSSPGKIQDAEEQTATKSSLASMNNACSTVGELQQSSGKTVIVSKSITSYEIPDNDEDTEESNCNEKNNGEIPKDSAGGNRETPILEISRKCPSVAVMVTPSSKSKAENQTPGEEIVANGSSAERFTPMPRLVSQENSLFDDLDYLTSPVKFSEILADMTGVGRERTPQPYWNHTPASQTDGKNSESCRKVRFVGVDEDTPSYPPNSSLSDSGSFDITKQGSIEKKPQKRKLRKSRKQRTSCRQGEDSSLIRDESHVPEEESEKTNDGLGPKIQSKEDKSISKRKLHVSIAPSIVKRGHLSVFAEAPTLCYQKKAIPENLRQAFLNARLAKCWRLGDAWARLDVSGVEIRLKENQQLMLDQAIAAMTQHHGEHSTEAALVQLETEWESLKSSRQKYAGTVNIQTPHHNYGPKSILKYNSAISALYEEHFDNRDCCDALEEELTPPNERGTFFGTQTTLESAPLAGTPVATTPQAAERKEEDWADEAYANLSARMLASDTSGIPELRSRGSRMLASLHKVAASKYKNHNISNSNQAVHDSQGGILSKDLSKNSTKTAARESADYKQDFRPLGYNAMELAGQMTNTYSDASMSSADKSMRQGQKFQAYADKKISSRGSKLLRSVCSNTQENTIKNQSVACTAHLCVEQPEIAG